MMSCQLQVASCQLPVARIADFRHPPRTMQTMITIGPLDHHWRNSLKNAAPPHRRLITIGLPLIIIGKSAQKPKLPAPDP
jgi:hypothetical protein